MPTLRCDMRDGCKEAVTHIDRKGFTYCSQHGKMLKLSGRSARKLTKRERLQLERGEPIKQY